MRQTKREILRDAKTCVDPRNWVSRYPFAALPVIAIAGALLAPRMGSKGDKESRPDEHTAKDSCRCNATTRDKRDDSHSQKPGNFCEDRPRKSPCSDQNRQQENAKTDSSKPHWFTRVTGSVLFRMALRKTLPLIAAGFTNPPETAAAASDVPSGSPTPGDAEPRFDDAVDLEDAPDITADGPLDLGW